jgi:uncharacterized membrane protein YkvA (DUF1232 family)
LSAFGDTPVVASVSKNRLFARTPRDLPPIIEGQVAIRRTAYANNKKMSKLAEIHSLIDEAKNNERKTGVLYRAVLELARQNGEHINALQAGKVIDFVTGYIERVPALMSAVENAATANDRDADVRPLLDAIEDFFLAPDDIIPDHFGLAGLLDDAYLAHTLLAEAARDLEQESGQRFLPEEADRTNRFIRRLIGEPFASILDEHVARTIDELDGMQTAGRLLIEFARVELTTIIGSLGFNTRVTEITGVRI